MNPMLMMSLISAAGGMGTALLQPKQKAPDGFNRQDILNNEAHGESLFKDRAGQINDFSNQLANARQQYLGQIQNLNQSTFGNFFGDTAAQAGARGLTTNGGAVASVLGKEALGLQSNMYNNAFSSLNNNLNAVNGAQGQNYQNMFGVLNSANAAASANFNPNGAPPNPAWGAAGGLFGMGTAAGLGGWLNQSGAGGGSGPTGPSMGGASPWPASYPSAMAPRDPVSGYFPINTNYGG